ncbi:hypothetical protein DY000_02013978 [Brassica cretica]|uniref:ATP-dependent RNA helicase Ski2/MTR4 C-terminal domain-containing protein n=1 Tax=Brassica cretica TaxID=69181 RepID=A0ABQ7D2F9_BRACR|nr:hypothetical protein DY000_02013978 [Brassica cretica]
MLRFTYLVEKHSEELASISRDMGQSMFTLMNKPKQHIWYYRWNNQNAIVLHNERVKTHTLRSSKFYEIMEIVVRAFRGSLIRTTRRMEKVLKNLTVAGKFIGATQLEAKLEEAVSQIKRTLDSHHLSTCDAIWLFLFT